MFTHKGDRSVERSAELSIIDLVSAKAHHAEPMLITSLADCASGTRWSTAVSLMCDIRSPRRGASPVGMAAMRQRVRGSNVVLLVPSRSLAELSVCYERG